MKKTVISLLLIAVLLSLAACHSVAESQASTAPGAATRATRTTGAPIPDLSDMAWKDAMRALYLSCYGWPKDTLEDITVTEYISYGDVHIAFVTVESRSYLYQGNHHCEAGECDIWYSDLGDLFVYTQEALYPFREACDLGVLTADRLAEFYEFHKGNFPGLYQEPDISGLGWQEALKIAYVWQSRRELEEAAHIRFEEYATFGDLHVVMLGSGPLPAEYEYLYDGNLFWYPTSGQLTVYRDGELRTASIEYAYLQGWFTPAQIDQLYSIHREKNMRHYEYWRKPEYIESKYTILDMVGCRDDQIYLTVYPAFPCVSYGEYTPIYFREVGCIAVELVERIPAEKGQPGLYKLRLTLDQHSARNVLECIKILEQRDDFYSAEPVRE